MQFLSLCVLLPVATWATPLGRGYGHGSWPHNGAARAAYFLDNDPSGSSVVSLHIGKNRHLSDPIRTSTDGYGAIGTNLTGFPNTADTLMSQSSVVVSGNLLFTVNAGSNTLALFSIEADDPWHPRLIGAPADTMGDFPMSVTYSEELRMACVLNGGTKSGISCFNVDSTQGLKANGPLRSLGNTIHESTPPSGPPGSAAQVIFDPASAGAFAIIKGNAGTTPITPGSIVGFRVKSGRVSTKPIITQIADIAMEFGSVFLSESQLLVTDPSYGASILELGEDLKFTETAHIVIASQKAICWAEFDPVLNTAYANDAGQNKIYKIDATTGARTGAISVTGDGNTNDAGVFDAAVDVRTSTMYALIGGNGVIVVDLKQGKQIQFLDLSSFGSRVGCMGMALY